MELVEINQLLKAALGNEPVDLQAEGNKLTLKLVSDKFAGLNRVKRQQLVYTILNEKIASGEIHAVTMKTLTPDEAGAAG